MLNANAKSSHHIKIDIAFEFMLPSVNTPKVSHETPKLQSDPNKDRCINLKNTSNKIAPFEISFHPTRQRQAETNLDDYFSRYIITICNNYFTGVQSCLR